MIDFSAINSFNNGQRDSFEELVCVLARREPPEAASEFQANEGSGGDGGVEAIWLLDDGSKVGYQAKFFLSIGDSQWKQMDESVTKALTVHPELIRYVFALPRDLTPDRGAKVRGKSERQKWDQRVQKWKRWAAEKSIEIEFDLWSETILKEMLLREGNTALIKFWFSGDVLSETWFGNQIDSATKMLGDRFNPDDHVEVSIETLFDTIARGTGITDQLRTAFAELEQSVVPSIKFTSTEHAPDVATLLVANDAWKELVELKGSFLHDFSTEWDFGSAVSILDRLRDAIWTLERQHDLLNKESLAPENQSKLESVSNSLHDLSSSCSSLSSFFRNKYLKAEALQCAVIYGPAGAGKSHTLGEMAEKRARQGLPTVLVLGQSLTNSLFWEQIGGVLGLEGRTVDDILGVLNAAGERKGERTILLFDAINEGVGAQYWMQNLQEVVNAIQRYSHLAAVFSCREEYLPYAILDSLSEKLPKFLINGFSTPEELEQAAIRYLDAKGIARPNTPWRSPEFSNPLFLKSVSEALHAKGLTEFPLGLNGASNILVLYLDALSWRTGIETINPNTISTSIKECVRLVADRMATEGCDFVEVGEATIFAEESFKGRTPPEGKTWLQVLIETSLFRLDPSPYSEDVDPFNPPPELVRFAFQRFQDHLMATYLVSKVEKKSASVAFDRGGPLNFLFYSGQQDHGFRHDYAGLLGALSTIYPEKLGLEFAKTLPDWEQHWEEGQLLQEAFGESFKWRSVDAFSDATRELLNCLNDHYIEPLGLLLEVSMSVDHPYNAFYLHSRLKQCEMPERDSRWTRWINWASGEEFNQAERIISWALSIFDCSADVKHLELASVILAWALSSSRITLRDRATKALTTIFLADARVFDFLLEKMHDCDDPYIVERLYAAAYGACCIDQNTDRLKSYSCGVFAKVFSKRQPPVALLTRDYALGIIELANCKGALESKLSLEDCYHPFNSDTPIFGMTKETVENIAEERGCKKIFHSSSSEWGDYGKYSIPGRVRSFLTTLLDHPKPISKEQLKQTFIKEVIFPYVERVEALEELESAITVYAGNPFLLLKGEFDEERMESETEVHKEMEANALRHLESLLDEGERKRLSTEYFRNYGDSEDFDSVDLEQCRLWVTKRAYELGWNSELFPNDGNHTSYSRHENDFERIGKKYQRIALDEIQARLADNFWILQDWPAKPFVYRYSNHEFRRNIDPTILPTDTRFEAMGDSPKDWIVEPKIILPEVEEADLKQWPFQKDPTQSMTENLIRIDENGKRWLVLYEYSFDKQKYPGPCRGEHGMRIEEFRFLYCVFLKRGKAREFAEFLETKHSLDGHSFQPIEITDGPFLREAYWRDTWPTKKFSDYEWGAPDGCEFAIPISDYHWESHLDKTLPNGFTNYMPQKWFANELGLSMSETVPQAWQNKFGSVVIQAQRPSEHQIVVVIDEDTLNSYSDDFEIEPFWLMIAERNTWPNGRNDESCWRRSEGAVWQERSSWQKVRWNKDTKR